MKQKEDSLKRDWYQTLEKYFKFIGVDMKYEDIIKIPKSEYKRT